LLSSIASLTSRNNAGPPTAIRTLRRVLLLAVALAPFLPVMPAQAQAMRTYVSGVGKDGNPCTVSQPCQTFQAALAQTAAGGEIYTLDSANYGYVTINKAISIVSGSGAAGILAASTSATGSVTGITINAGANDTVTLQGLDIDGAGSGSNGILFASGASLNIRDSVIRGFTAGINFQSTGSSNISVGNTRVSNNAHGIMLQNMGPGIAVGILNDVQVVNNGTGISALGTSSAASANLTVQNSVVVSNPTVGILSAGYSTVTVVNSTVANNGV